MKLTEPMDYYKEIEKDLFYEYSKILKSLTLSDIKDWSNIIELLIIVTIDTIKNNERIFNLKQKGLNQKESVKGS